jgi:hypothetical protein
LLPRKWQLLFRRSLSGLIISTIFVVLMPQETEATMRTHTMTKPAENVLALTQFILERPSLLNTNDFIHTSHHDIVRWFID